MTPRQANITGLLFSIVAAAIVGAVLLLVVKPSMAAEPCTEVLGFSQTGEWYGSFELVVVNSEWQRRIKGGMDINLWGNPDSEAWRVSVASRCPGPATRALLTVSDSRIESNPQVWADLIDRAITAILDPRNLPDVAEVIVQAVVGGPRNGLCQFNGRDVRASVNHSVINQAIALVVANHSADVKVTAGFSPEVENCNQYRDQPGHLTPIGAAAVGEIIGAFYAAGFIPPAPDPDPDPGPLVCEPGCKVITSRISGRPFCRCRR